MGGWCSGEESHIVGPASTEVLRFPHACVLDKQQEQRAGGDWAWKTMVRDALTVLARKRFSSQVQGAPLYMDEIVTSTLIEMAAVLSWFRSTTRLCSSSSEFQSLSFTTFVRTVGRDLIKKEGTWIYKQRQRACLIKRRRQLEKWFSIMRLRTLNSPIKTPKQCFQYCSPPFAFLSLSSSFPRLHVLSFHYITFWKMAKIWR